MTSRFYAWRIVCWRPWTFWIGSGGYALFISLPLATGLLTRTFFDTLTGNAPAQWSIWTIICLLVAI